MIAYLKGIVAAKSAHAALVEVAGIGYELSLSTQALAALPAVGSTAQVWTYLQVKDDGLALFGFIDPAEKEMFLKLIGVSGVGPKIALAALSVMGAGELASVIAEGDVTRVSSVPGIGKKTAQRVVLELQGSLQAVAPTLDTLQAGSVLSDAAQALEGMGFSPDEVASALKGCTAQGADVSSLVRSALKHLGGAR